MSKESKDFLMFCWFPENAISIFRVIEIKPILARLPRILTSASHFSWHRLRIIRITFNVAAKCWRPLSQKRDFLKKKKNKIAYSWKRKKQVSSKIKENTKIWINLGRPKCSHIKQPCAKHLPKVGPTSSPNMQKCNPRPRPFNVQAVATAGAREIPQHQKMGFW